MISEYSSGPSQRRKYLAELGPVGALRGGWVHQPSKGSWESSSQAAGMLWDKAGCSPRYIRSVPQQEPIRKRSEVGSLRSRVWGRVEVTKPFPSLGPLPLALYFLIF